MNGIPKEVEKKMLEYNGHITLESRQTISNAADQVKYLENTYSIKASPVTLAPVLMQKENGDSEFLVAKGILPSKDQEVSKIKDWLVDKKAYNIQSNEIIISTTTAEILKLKIGNKVLLHSPEKYKTALTSTEPSESQKAQEFIIANLYSSNVPDVDKHFIIIHHSAANELMNLEKAETMQIDIALQDPYQAEAFATKMKSDRNLRRYRITPWHQRDNVSSLTQLISNQKALMMFVLFFIVIGAAIGVAACLFSIVIQKTQEIGILKATGVSPLSIIQVFVGQGTALGCIGTGLGFIGGIITLINRQAVANFLGAWDNELYKLKEVPVYYDTTEISFIVIGAILVCSLASSVPAIIAASVNPVKALQSQG
jgi:lipoprotein-releasing system permease protein